MQFLKKMKNPKVSIIILNWNGWKDTIECLESLYQINYNNYEVILVDNDSKDESIEKIKEWAKGNIEVNSKFFKYNKKNKPIKVFEYSKEELENNKYLKNKTKLDKLKSDKKLFLLKNDNNYGYNRCS
jgi:GT2 family glycosyltransferase